jgi:hypothetical protein
LPGGSEWAGGLSCFLKEIFGRGQDEWRVISGYSLILEGGAKAEYSGVFNLSLSEERFVPEQVLTDVAAVLILRWMRLLASIR